ncbi:MAG TPA: SpoIIE family protein phosphatase [Acidimicrobiales bacterium]|jgi:PAS domain S-box-containing protein|nr:SpoIIE family protein phosphatase [Acidimicrobiales bacterium]
MTFPDGHDETKIEEPTEEEALWRLVTALASCANPFEVAEALAAEGGGAAGGSFANMAILTTEANLVHIVHRPAVDALGNRWLTYELDDHVPGCDAIRNGLPVLLGSVEEIQARYPLLTAEMEEAGLQARASLPIHGARGETLGALGFGWSAPQSFDAAQLRRLDLIAQLSGLALERAKGTDTGMTHGRMPGVVETMPNALFTMDASFVFTYINAEGERLLQASRDELIGINLFEAFPEALGSEFERQYRLALSSGRTVVFEAYYGPLAGWFEVHAWPDQQGLNVYFADISERRAETLEREQALAETQLTNIRLSFLTALSTQLAGARTRTEIFDRLCSSVVSAMGDWCTVVVPAGDELVRIAAGHRDPALNGLARRLVGGYPHAYSGPSPGVVVYKSGEPLRLTQLAQQIVDELDNSMASAAYGRTLQLMGDGPGLIMPIFSRGEVTAVLTTVRVGGAPFADDDVALMTDVTACVANALDDVTQNETQRETVGALQAAALPSSLPTSDHLTLAAGYRAANEGGQVGGDWYDAFELQNGWIALVVGDAAGHGLHAAALMAQLRNSLRAHLFDSMGPSEALVKLSTFIAVQEPEAFATIICVEIDPATGDVVWASAGHPGPILLRRDGTSQHLRGEPAPPIGSAHLHSPNRAVEHRFTLSPDDRLLMFTDGLFERRGIDLEIGLTHLMITAEQTRNSPSPERACETILEEMLLGSHDDDVCLLVADFTPKR